MITSLGLPVVRSSQAMCQRCKLHFIYLAELALTTISKHVSAPGSNDEEFDN
jgi:hypothetical protein